MPHPFVPTRSHALQPALFWDAFFWLCETPHVSRDEAAIITKLRDGFAGLGFGCRVDAAGNLVVRVPATPGSEHAPPIVVQSHVDMVPGKRDGDAHDWARDPIAWIADAEWVHTAGRTTLGADNGIGVAAAIATALDPAFVHGPLELLFTVREEVGLEGAKELDASLLAGRVVLNLDTEEPGVVFIGCAGARVLTLATRVAAEAVPASLDAGLDVAVRELRGGHSGADIHLGLANANQSLAALLGEAAGIGAIGGASALPFAVAGIDGGGATNQIAARAAATLAVRAGDAAAWRELAARHQRDLRARFPDERSLVVEATPAGRPARTWPAADTTRSVATLRALHHGVIAMSPVMPGLVETSCNFARVAETDGALRAVLSVRSSSSPALEAALGRFTALGALGGFAPSVSEGYPAWTPNLDSPLLALAKDVHARLHGGAELPLLSIHAGLETAVLGEKLGGADMLSYGPEIHGAHTPEERVRIATVEPFLAFHRELVHALARRGVAAVAARG